MPIADFNTPSPPDPTDDAAAGFMLIMLMGLGTAIFAAFWKTFLFVAVGAILVIGAAIILRALTSR